MKLPMNDMTFLSILLSASLVVKAVLIVLVLFSVYCWAIIIAKTIRFGKALKEDEKFEELFWQATGFRDLYRFSKTLNYSPMAGVFQDGYEEYERLKEELKGIKSMKAWLDNMERGLEKGLTIQLWDLERGIGWLATIGNASPFIGLFGTVWGIMQSFHQIGLTGSTTLAEVAPGISEALIATAMGLWAAIPAVIAFNWFTGRLAEVEGDLRCFKSDFLNIVERQLVSSADNILRQRTWDEGAPGSGDIEQ